MNGIKDKNRFLKVLYLLFYNIGAVLGNLGAMIYLIIGFSVPILIGIVSIVYFAMVCSSSLVLIIGFCISGFVLGIPLFLGSVITERLEKLGYAVQCPPTYLDYIADVEIQPTILPSHTYKLLRIEDIRFKEESQLKEACPNS